MSDLKVINHKLSLAKNVKEIFTLGFVEERATKNYAAATGRKDAKNWYQGEVLAIMSIFAQKPDYMKADKMSIWGCIMEAGRKGLSIADGDIDLVPYNKGAILKAEPNYKGLRKQLRTMPSIKFVNEAQVVWKGEEFVHDKLNNKIIKHVAGEEPKEPTLANITAAYVRLEFNDNSFKDVVMYQKELMFAKSKTKNNYEDGPWNTTPWEMCKKSVVKRANKAYHNKERAEIADDEFSKFSADDTKDADFEDVTTSEQETPPAQSETTQTVQAEVVQEPAKKEEVKKEKTNMSKFLEE